MHFIPSFHPKWLIMGIASCAFFLLTACGLGPIGLCENIHRNWCTKIHECTAESDKQNSTFLATWGKDVDECLDRMKNGRTYGSGGFKVTIEGENCQEKTEANYCSGESKKVYHPEQAQQCMKDWSEASCSKALEAFYQPDSCKIICQDS